ncbi:MAG: hypothetical protein AVO38_13585 [delta proteobacterium ML8_D]|jgi:iron complex transport system substrate-binding protein|nr:MAG: hypothetical protein AVO34_10085 [Firmicutes bacterium ML8_F2]OPL13257.1 MAG: hypothetical protein AVO38_13585 [delta proteobacterium ML8_D]
MRRKTILVAIVLLSFTSSYLGKKAMNEFDRGICDFNFITYKKDHNSGGYRLIVSLAPSITEILFALGVEDRIAGVTRYCDFPLAARTKTRVGGYYDPNYESIVKLCPDLVIMLEGHEGPRRYLPELGLNTLMVNHEGISGILNSITVIGKTCGVGTKAESMVQDLRSRMEEIRQKTQGLPRPRVVISVEKNIESGTLKDVCISGREKFYNEMITLAGGVNAYNGDVAFPIVSREGIVQMNPEVIIEIIPDIEEKDRDQATTTNEWAGLSQIDAVRKGRICDFREDYTVIPGPRFILILEKMARLIHPEVDWK